MITADRINQLANLAKVKKIAVENFLGTLGGMSKDDALNNLTQDARDYRWNAPTVNAIRKGILEHFGRG